jgi:small GTP-binding protein
MIQKKVCLAGSFAVGKTSLVSRFVTDTFSGNYLTTIGVKVERRSMHVDDRPIDLIVWDLHGEDEFQKVRAAYFRGASGCLLVADLTRRATLDKALQLRDEVRRELGHVPCVFAFNKSDLVDEREIGDAALDDLRAQGAELIATSAKTGLGVEQAFDRLVRQILGV